MSDPGHPSLTQLRGPLPEARMSARSTAALLDNPGCVRRAVVDAAGIDAVALAKAVGHPAPFGQSPFALGQGNRFEARVKADGYAELVRVVRELGINLPDHLTTVTIGKGRNDDRVARTSTALADIAGGDPSAPNVIDQGMTTLTVGDSTVYLEQDALAFYHGGKLHVCEVKGFPLIDGSAEPEKVGAAARQSAVYIASIEDTLASLGLATVVVSHDVLLICPRNYTTQPTAATVNVTRELRALRRQLARRTRLDDALAQLDLTPLATSGNGGDVAAHSQTLLQVLPYRYEPECMSRCDLARACRAQAVASDTPAVLGGEAVNLLAGCATINQARHLATGEGPIDPDDEDVALVLQRARQAHQALTGRPIMSANTGERGGQT